MSSTQSLYNHAKEVIPGGSQLYSKRSELYAPGLWPAYYKSAKGIEVIDLDNNRFLDFTTSGLGACILGYSDPDVDNAVTRSIHSGSSSSLNCPEEVELADMLLTLHPWAGGVRFARSGGEAMAIAIRIAQTYTGHKDLIRTKDSYHGWYVNSPITDTDYLPWTGTGVAAIIRETRRHNTVTKESFQGTIKRAKLLDAVTIFDEITSGFRFNLGGAHLHYGVNPDIAVFAKAISNGYPMAAVIGTKEVMAAAEDTFISSTSWSERTGPAAAIATIQKLWANNVHEQLYDTGSAVQSIWNLAAKSSGLDIKVTGPAQLSYIEFDSTEKNTIFTQLMLERGFLATKDFYPTYAHTKGHLHQYLTAIKEVFELMAKGVQLKGPVAEIGFKRNN